MIHMNDSKMVKKFLAKAGLKITKGSCHNHTILKNVATGEKLELWAESDYSVAAGIPGIFVDENGLSSIV